MAKQLQLRRGTTQANDLFTGANGEVTVDTTKHSLRVHDGSTQGGYLVDTVVFFQRPTAENNYTWARKYASGWVEQGGIYNNGSVARDLTTTIDLPITMANNNYTAITTGARNTGDYANRSGYSTIYTQSTTQLGIGYYGVGTSDTMQYISWRVEGMAA